MKYVGKVISAQSSAGNPDYYDGMALIGGAPGNSTEPYQYQPRPQNFESDPQPFSGMIVPFKEQKLPSAAIDGSEAWIAFELKNLGSTWMMGSPPPYIAVEFDDRWVVEDETAVDSGTYETLYGITFGIASLLYLIAGIAHIVAGDPLYRFLGAAGISNNAELMAASKLAGAGLIVIAGIYGYLVVRRRRSRPLLRIAGLYSFLATLCFISAGMYGQITWKYLLLPIAFHAWLLLAVYLVNRNFKEKPAVVPALDPKPLKKKGN